MTSFDELYDMYHAHIYRFARALAGDARDAEDLFQETWLRAEGAGGSAGPDKCPGCGNPVATGHAFCPHCGKNLKLTCPACGKTVEGTWKACPSCGAGLDPGQPRSV